MNPTLGVCYYPEHWPEEIWATDAARMVDTGLTWVRIGEFAWTRMEPKPGQLDLAWLDRAIDTLGNAGLKVVLGTPTATPPRWMIDKHPDMLARDVSGQIRKFGSRRHYCFSHEGYRAESARIARILGERYGRHEHVHAWQIDNEYACHNTTLSYSEAALSGFRNWLAQKYQSTDALNRAWGNVFWSMDYDDFDQIDLPNLTTTEPNPAHVLDFKRYSSDQVIAFNKVQTDTLRPLTDKPLIHNYMGRELTFDHFKLGADLDIASWDSYPIGFLSDRLEADEADKTSYLRQGDPDNQALHHDLYRAVGRGRWWIMEQQPGPVNWAPWNPAPLPGMARLWAWEAIAHGAEAVCYFRWRQAPFAQEQNHAGLLRPDSVAAPALAEAAQVAREIKDFGEVIPAQGHVAFLFDYEADWVFGTQPQGADFSYFRLVLDAYRALRRAGLSIDILPKDADLAGYKLVVAPGLAIMDDTLKTRLAEHDGHVIVGPRSGSKDQDGAIPVPLPPNLPGLDATVTFVESIPPGAQDLLEDAGSFVHWSERLEGTANVTLKTKNDHPALVTSGTLHYLAGWPDRAAWDHILKLIAPAAGLYLEVLPPGLRVRDTATHRFAFNYGAAPVHWRGIVIPPAGLHWVDI
ncbi:beta-galactosidase [Boseongicola aestuarii]|uniref:Beta-galactosidase n=1 Tax=Boseongicola aestuarii TaxID=1470561 RepID=A0A238J1K9_9RHOB|nr:beta-galactosidase [Boseongicola aestuarii]SMX23794.1 Beta-galactosidase [Boseongicola aestuarii]